MTIREIEGTPNYSEIIELINAEWPEEFGVKTEREKIAQMQAHHNVQTDTVKYLLDGDTIVGFYRYSRWPREDPQTLTAHLLDIALLPSYQGRGLGKRLMKDLIQDCSQKGLARLFSRSYRTNMRSIRLHCSMGFEEYKTTEDSIVWQLNLRSSGHDRSVGDSNISQSRYCWNSNEYAKHSTAQYTWALELSAKLGLQGGESVLDIGCGDGKVTAMIGSYLPNGKVTGIDSSEEMISFARSAYPPKEYPNLSFMRMDATRLGFRHCFDITFSNATLHWVKDHPAVLKGVKAGLRKPGRILFQMGGRGNAQDVVDTVNAVIATEPWSKYFRSFTFPYTFCSPEKYRSWLKEAGLEAKRVELIVKDMRQQGEEGLAGWFRTTWLPYLDRIPENKREKFIADVVRDYLERFPLDSDGIAHVNMVRLEVEAVNL